MRRQNNHSAEGRTISEEERGVDIKNLLLHDITDINDINDINDMENIKDTHYYIIRNGAFATKGEIKLLYSFISIYMCQDNSEYTYLFVISTSGWTLVELVLQTYGTRKIHDMTFFGQPLHRAFSVLLQGAQEGGFVCVYGIWFADRLATHWNYLVLSNMFILSMIVVNGYRTPITEQNASRRCITSFYPLLALTTTCIANTYAILYIETDRPIRMFFVMILLGTIWTSGQVGLGMRSVSHGMEPATTMETFAILMFDVLVEIACAYLPFYFIVQYIVK